MSTENKETKKKPEVTVTDLMEDGIEAVRQMDLVRLGKKQSDTSVADLKKTALKKITLYNNVVGIPGSLTISKARETISVIWSKNRPTDTKAKKKK
jgi:hypothetical protein